MRILYSFVRAWLFAGCSHLLSITAPKEPMGAAVIVYPAVVESVSNFRSCSNPTGKPIPAGNLEVGGRYEMRFSLTHDTAQLVKFRVDTETVPEISKEVVERCSNLALLHGNKTLNDTIHHPEFERIAKLNPEHTEVLAKGTLFPQPNAVIMSEPGVILLKLPLAGMQWK